MAFALGDNPKQSSSEPQNLENLFGDIISKNYTIQITLDTINNLLVKDLCLKTDNLNDNQKSALPYMLVSYIRKWPGWEKKVEFENGSIDKNSWYDRFRQYILYKMTLLITKTMSVIEKEIELEQKSIKLVSNQTQLSNRATFANFSIDVAGPATLLSNLVFWGCNDYVTVEEHSDRPWEILSNIQLLNYPYVEIEFNSPELSFKRSFEPKISRYLSGCADLFYDLPSFIMGKHRINTKFPKFMFPLSVLEEYINVYKVNIFPQISLEQQEEVTVILDQFYKDMLDISNDNSVAENRQVNYNIGKNLYKRSKKISNDEDDENPRVIFNEVFIPKLVSSFRYFTGMQEFTKDGLRVVSSKPVESKMMLNFKPLISYKCTFCKVNFIGPLGKLKLMNHFKDQHKREQPLLCLLCKKSFEIMQLAQQRWRCTCQKN